jgi:two-component sensor histidine kinase
MSTPAVTPDFFKPSVLTKRLVLAVALGAVVALGPFLLWPTLAARFFGSNDYLPHAFCYLRRPALVWTHVTADSLIGLAYLAISATLTYLVYKARRDIPFHWIFLAFGLFIIACGGTHVMEVVTIWKPVYVFSAVVKIFTALASLLTAAVLPYNVPHILSLVQKAKESEHVTTTLRASEERKEALLREVHHRVKNNLAVVCSLLYLQSTHTKDEATIQVFREMENRVHSMALVHETLYGSENLARIDFAEYAQVLAKDILASYGNLGGPVRLKSDMETVIMSIDLAVPCGLILNELISNAFKHGFPDRGNGEIKVTLRAQPENKCLLCVEDNGVGIPNDLDVNTRKSLGLRLVRSLTEQIRGSFELVRISPGTSARIQFMVNQHGR